MTRSASLADTSEQRAAWLHRVIACLAIVLAGSDCPAGPMIFADSFPLEHPISTEGNAWWMNRVSELTGGSITFRHFPAEQLARADDILQKVEDGVAQVGYVGIGYVSDELPLNGVTMLPSIVEDTVRASRAYWELLSSDTLFRREFTDSGVVPVFAVLLPPYQLVLARPPVETMADLAGLKLRVAGSMSLIVDAIDGTPVSMSAPDVYMAMQRGTLDGALLPVTSVRPYRVDEIATSISSNAAFGSFGITVVMNAATYAGLTAGQKAAIRQAGDETVAHLARVLQRDVDEALAAFRDGGIAVYSLDDELLRRLAGKAAQVQSLWVERMDDRELDGKRALEVIRQALACSGNPSPDARSSLPPGSTCRGGGRAR